ncbi:MAG: cell wall-binding repeat-containing protein [Actinobacteria bacterium]|nr:cell wall-binding repeat-containing protein [Actinomycetota bacterium]
MRRSPLTRLLVAPLLVGALLLGAGPAAAAAPLRPTTVAPSGLPTTWPGVLELELGDPAARRLVTATPGVLAAAPAFPGTSDAALDRWLSLEVTPGTEAQVAATLRTVPGVVSVAAVPVRVPAYEPNDPQRPQQWHLDRIGAGSGWAVSRGDRRVRLGIIDTRFDAGHPELAGVLFRRDGRAGVDTVDTGCRAGLPYSEHGTFVAGIAAAGTDNRTGVSSVGFSMGIVAVAAGVELSGSCLISPRWSRSLVELADAGVRVVNLSFASQGSSGSEAAAVRYATSQGTLVVAAAGNHGKTEPHYPAAYPVVLGVAATDAHDRLWASSNRGDWVDVAAPGVKLLTICPAGYCLATGTSTAAPVVAGIANLLATAQPGLMGLQLRGRVLDAAAEITGRSLDPAIGYGRVRLDRTMRQRSLRLYGRDRIATSRAVAQETHPGGRGPAVDRVVLVPADTPGDRGWVVTLPAAGLLADGRTAIVMTARERLSDSAVDELARLLDGPGHVVLPGGGQLGVSPAVEQELRRAGHTVERLGTADVAGTAAALADEIVRSSGRSAALVANGSTFADALSLAAAAAAHGYPLLFVDADHVPAATCAWIRDQGRVGTLHLAGGHVAISAAVEEELRDCTRGLLVGRDLTITRDAGASRVETSIAVARRHFGRTTRDVAVANGFTWPDAVTGGALAATVGAPVLLTSGRGALEAPLRHHLATAGARRSYILGGTAVVSDATRAAVEAATR